MHAIFGYKYSIQQSIAAIRFHSFMQFFKNLNVCASLDLPSVTYFFSSPKKVGKKRFLPSLFELLAQAIPENGTPPSNSVLPGHSQMA